MESVNKAQPLIDHMTEAELDGYRGVVVLFHPASLHVLVHWTSNTAFLGKKRLNKSEEALVTVLSGVKPDIGTETYELEDATDHSTILEKLKKDRESRKPSVKPQPPAKPPAGTLSQKLANIQAANEEEIMQFPFTARLAKKQKEVTNVLKAIRIKPSATRINNSDDLKEAIQDKSVVLVKETKGVLMPVQVKVPSKDMSRLPTNPDASQPTPDIPQSQPDDLQSQPAISLAQPVTLETQPVTLETQPVALETQPVTLETQPVTLETQHVTLQTQPLTSQAQPDISQTQPVTLQSLPATSEAQPTTSQTRPVTSEKQPATSQSQPVISQAKPATSETQPATSQTPPPSSLPATLETQVGNKNLRGSDTMIVAVNCSDGIQRYVKVVPPLVQSEAPIYTNVVLDEPASTIVIGEESDITANEEVDSDMNDNTESSNSVVVVATPDKPPTSVDSQGNAIALGLEVTGEPEQSGSESVQHSLSPDAAVQQLTPTLLNEEMKRDHCYSTPNFVPLSITKLANGNVAMMTKKEISESKELGGIGAKVLMSRKSLTFYQCTICNRKISKRQMRLHELSHRGEKPYGCSFCSKKFANKHVCLIHERIHRGEKPFKCPTCGKTFRQKYHVTNHLKTVHLRAKSGEKELCSVCGKGFASRAGLARHAKIHTGPAEFHCQVCSKKFLTRSHLRKHSYTHKPAYLACSVCGKKFRYASGLKEHALVHTDEKPYKCKVCGKSFKMEKRMKRHEQLHNEEPQQCSICELWFSSKNLLKKHVTSGQCQPIELYSIPVLD